MTETLGGQFSPINPPINCSEHAVWHLPIRTVEDKMALNVSTRAYAQLSDRHHIKPDFNVPFSSYYGNSKRLFFFLKIEKGVWGR